jgi:hypothetical protein
MAKSASTISQVEICGNEAGGPPLRFGAKVGFHSPQLLLSHARERLQKGIVASDVITPSQEKLSSGTARARLESQVITNPIRPAESRYIREQGIDRFNELLERLFGELFPPEAF